MNPTFKNVINTILSKSGILLLNFAIVILTTKIWGATGRGIISILFADISLIVIINNILSSSSIAYFTSSEDYNKLIKPGYLWIFLTSTAATFVFSNILKHGDFKYIFILTVLTSLVNFNFSVFIGGKKLTAYNIYNFLAPLITISIVLLSIYIKPNSSIIVYFYSYGIAYFVIWIVSLYQIKPNITDFKKIVDFSLIKKVFDYGWKNETSSFLQFLSYRFSYFIILYYLGIKNVGIFSIGIAIAESVWIISKSLSLVLYSQTLGTEDHEQSIKQTNQLAIISTISTLFIGLIILIIPAQWFSFIFGKEFLHVKSITLLLYPGIIFIAFSNIYGHYLAAVGEQYPLILKSVYGLFATLILSWILIPRWGINGACIATVMSHLVSSIYVYYAFITKINNAKP